MKQVVMKIVLAYDLCPWINLVPMNTVSSAHSSLVANVILLVCALHILSNIVSNNDLSVFTSSIMLKCSCGIGRRKAHFPIRNNVTGHWICSDCPTISCLIMIRFEGTHHNHLANFKLQNISNLDKNIQPDLYRQFGPNFGNKIKKTEYKVSMC